MRLYLNNNGFGSSVLQMLIKTSIKPNLYYEIKDRVTEEEFDGVTVRRRPRKCKVYGATSNHAKRNQLIELLHQRVQHHRDKFNSKEIYNELCTMVVKPNGKVEHADDAHDDLVFSYLWALYVFYHGEELATRFHFMKTEIYTDDHYDETSYSLEEEYMEGEKVDSSVFADSESDVHKIVESQMKVLNSSRSITLEDIRKIQLKEDEKALKKIISTKPGREAISQTYNVPEDYLEKQNDSSVVDITGDIANMWYNDINSDEKHNANNPTLTGNLKDLFGKIQ